jgi:putative intracellular protease/amidase
VVGENSSTVLVDFVIPYSVLTQSGAADVVSVATQTGPLKLPPLRIDPDSTVAQFDARYPEGADYVIVPAVMKNDDPTLVAWVASQAAKGATMVSICNGSLVLANAGLTRGHRATGHWSTYGSRVAKYPDTRWLKNTRYVADGKIVSSAGITAALPVSIALVEAIAGTERAQSLAKQLGVDYWGPEHNSEVFHIGFGDYLTGFSNSALHARQEIGVPLTPGVDDIALALTAEAYSDTMRGTVYAVAPSAAPIKTRNGLMFIPDRVAGQGTPIDLMLPAWDAMPSAYFQQKVIDDITRLYGKATARFVILDWEYPGDEREVHKSAAN